MGTSIQYGFNASNAIANINRSSASASSSVARLSSGNRIQQASDDVAGLSVGTSLQTRITALRSGLSNAAQGTSVLQVADGGLSQIVDILQRQKAIAVQAGSGSLTDTNRALLNQEFQALSAEADRIAANTSFNGVSLLSGGLGITPTLVSTDALAAAVIVANASLNSGTTFVPSNYAIQGRNPVTGSTNNRTLRDNAGAILANGAYLNASPLIYGGISKFEFSNVNYGAVGVGSGTLTVTYNGVDYSTNVVSTAGSPFYLLRNANTVVALRLAPITLTDAGTQAYTTAQMINGETTIFVRTSVINGVDFEGTALDGAIGVNGNAALVLAGNGAVSITDFRYEGNQGAANTNTLTVKVNGRTFTANGVSDQISAAGNGKLQFGAPGNAEILSIDVTGLTTTIGNIRTNLADRQGFVDALNIGFSRAGVGLNFNLGSSNNDNINIKYGSASTVSIYGGQSLNVASTSSAATASTVLDTAINQVISLRATVGALQSRFDFATNSLQASIEGQDSARGTLLDTDIASESTAFAASQVQVQAGISVLAQANNLSSNLLKLLELQ